MVKLPGDDDNSHVYRGKGIEALHAEENPCKHGVSQREQAKVHCIETLAKNAKTPRQNGSCRSRSFGGDL